MVLGDFNEWATGPRHAAAALAPARAWTSSKHLSGAARIPGVLPMLHLDHIYHDEPLELVALDVHRTRTALVASDHLPLVADFKYVKGVEPAHGAAGNGSRQGSVRKAARY